jgi:hypothetical protein
MDEYLEPEKGVYLVAPKAYDWEMRKEEDPRL